MVFSSWLRSLKSRWLHSSTRRPRPSRPWHGRPSVRPLLEQLEDRLTPTAGVLDPTFGGGTGHVLSLFPNETLAAANAVAVQSDSKIVIAGVAGYPSQSPTFLVARYNADGSLDTSFGTGGYTATGFPKGPAHAQAVAIQSDGKILAAGYEYYATVKGALSTYNFAMARYNANGTLDTTFGNNGEVVTPGMGTASSIVVQKDGKILGFSNSGYGTGGGIITLVRYNTNGTLDTTFGNGGELVTNITRYSTQLIQPDGKFVFAWQTSSKVGNFQFEIARLNADGTTDSSFGSGGAVYTNNFSVSTAALQADGKIVVSGLEAPSGNFGLIRYNADGTLDTTFGTSGNGIVTVPQPGSLNAGGGKQLEVQSDGKIVAISYFTNSAPGAFGAVRVNADGTLDTSYGNGGWATAYIPYKDTLNASVLQPDGKLLLAGEVDPTGSGSSTDVALIRFTGDTTAASFSVTGFPSSVTAGTAGTLTVTALNPDGSVNTGYTGTVHFTSSDPHAVLPADYTFTAADQGVHTFNATLVTAGSQSISAIDTTTSTMLGFEWIQVNPAAASQFILSAPSSVLHRSQFSVTLTVEDAYGNVVTGYVGTVHFTSSDGSATLPADYTFTAADAGVHTFSNGFMLRTRGKQTLSVTDTQNSALTATDSLNVT
jgi:uncharacterized delta-60 repeat protein